MGSESCGEGMTKKGFDTVAGGSCVANWVVIACPCNGLRWKENCVMEKSLRSLRKWNCDILAESCEPRSLGTKPRDEVEVVGDGESEDDVEWEQIAGRNGRLCVSSVGGER